MTSASIPFPAVAGEKPARDEEVVDVAGFTAYLSRAAQRHPRREATLAALAVRLTAIEATFPPSARDDLRRTPIWLTERGASASSGSSATQGPLFHADAGSNLPLPQLANAIEIPSITMLSELLAQENPQALNTTLTNVLAAGYFMHLSSPPWREAEDAFHRAKTNLVTAKLGSDPLSYFSALSTEYFGRCSLPPDREALRAADPRGVALITRTWLTPVRTASREH